jgi:hypothetical protein
MRENKRAWKEQLDGSGSFDGRSRSYPDDPSNGMEKKERRAKRAVKGSLGHSVKER